MSFRMILPAVAIALPLLLTACGDDDDSPQPTPQATSPSGDATATPTVEADNTPGAFSGSTDAVRKDPPSGMGPAILTNVRAAAQEGFDRIVFEFEGNQVPGYAIEYKDAAISCGSGQDITEFIGGGEAPAALLTVNLRPTDAHDQNGNATAARDVPARLQTIQRAFSTCDFEAVVEYAVALSAEKPFRVSTLQNPSRLVIDIAQ